MFTLVYQPNRTYYVVYPDETQSRASKIGLAITFIYNDEMYVAYDDSFPLYCGVYKLTAVNFNQKDSE